MINNKKNMVIFYFKLLIFQTITYTILYFVLNEINYRPVVIIFYLI
jgi:hypothetical protein